MRDRSGLTTIATWTSWLGHPFIMTLLMVVTAGMHVATPGETAWAVLVVIGVGIVPVAGLMAHEVRTGRWQNLDASNPAERRMVYALSILLLILLLLWLLRGNADSYLLRGVPWGLALVTSLALVNRWIKASVHMAFASMAATIAVFLGSVTAFFLVPGLPLLAWSRLYLSRHRPGELAVGATLGILAGLAVRLFSAP
jgi:hypothetical protein